MIGLGSNLGDTLGQLTRARAALGTVLDDLHCSPLYETPPWGVTDQPSFLNAVCVGSTLRDPHDLLRALKDLERQLGRVPGRRWGPRAIDLDLLLYGDLILHTPDLTIPHPRLHERAFVLVPLADLLPDLPHPQLHQRVRDLLHVVDCSGITRSPAQWSDSKA